MDAVSGDKVEIFPENNEDHHMKHDVAPLFITEKSNDSIMNQPQSGSTNGPFLPEYDPFIYDMNVDTGELEFSNFENTS